ncbi:peptidylprolyl isomerase [bacterium]|nr:peptidylprolyl isomerase [bacterium]
MSTTKSKHRIIIIGLVLLAGLLAACSQTSTPTAEGVVTPSATATPSEPTPTPVPAAAIINGERLPLAWYQGELQRYLLAQENLGTPVEDQTAASELVLNDLIDQMLLAQAAQQAGTVISDADVQARLDALAAEVDLGAWMAQWGYTDVDLFEMLRFQLLAASQRDTLAATIPEVMEQVEIQQVFAYTSDGAQNAKVALDSGTSFDEEAFLYDPIAGGYLGWVPRGYLLIPAVEEAAFTLPVGSYSDIIESEIGYHIVLVLDRGDHPLSSDARLTLQRQAVQNWLENQRTNSAIEILDH